MQVLKGYDPYQSRSDSLKNAEGGFRMRSQIYFEQVPIDTVKKIVARQESEVKDFGAGTTAVVPPARRNPPDNQGWTLVTNLKYPEWQQQYYNARPA
jgi:hypothetical protein